MEHEGFETKLLRQQEQYIRTLEEQLTVYEEKDKAQGALLEKLNQTLQIFTEEISRLKEEKAKSDRKKMKPYE